MSYIPANMNCLNISFVTWCLFKLLVNSSIYIYIYIYIYWTVGELQHIYNTYIHTYINTCVRTYIHTHTHIHTYIYISNTIITYFNTMYFKYDFYYNNVYLKPPLNIYNIEIRIVLGIIFFFFFGGGGGGGGGGGNKFARDMIFADDSRFRLYNPHGRYRVRWCVGERPVKCSNSPMLWSYFDKADASEGRWIV